MIEVVYLIFLVGMGVFLIALTFAAGIYQGVWADMADFIEAYTGVAFSRTHWLGGVVCFLVAMALVSVVLAIIIRLL